jgi:uncharacterized RDD family membrane protein YckC
MSMEKENPYKAPECTSSSPALKPEDSPPSASHALRLRNFICDSLVVVPLMIGMGIAASKIPAIAVTYSEWSTIINWGTYFSYYFLSETLFGKTLGKLLTGTKVVNSEGSRLTLSQLAVRNLIRLIPFEAFSFLGAEPEGWHDTLSRSYVVKAR